MNFQRILLIDDDQDDQELFLTAVSQISDKVDCVALADARMALKKLRTEELQPEAIFLDLNMPVMNGQQFLTELKNDPSIASIPVIMFSTSSQLSTIQLTKKLGALDYIVKPDNYSNLVTILSRYIG